MKAKLKVVQKSAIVAAVGLIVMAILAPIAHFGIFGSMISMDDATATLANIEDGRAVFLFGAICLFAVAVLDVVVALALERFLGPAKSRLTQYMSLSRIVYAAIFMVAIFYLAVIPFQLYAGMEMDADYTISSISKFNFLWDVAYMLFAIHLVLLGWLFLKTSYTSSWVAPLLVIAGLGYGIDSIGRLLILGYDIEIATVAFIGEVVLIFWLLIKGRTLGSKDIA